MLIYKLKMSSDMRDLVQSALESLAESDEDLAREAEELNEFIDDLEPEEE